MNKDSLPCINCITLTMCKSMYNETMKNPNITLNRYIAMGNIMDKYSIIQDYIYDDDKISNSDHVKTMHNYMMEYIND